MRMRAGCRGAEVRADMWRARPRHSSPSGRVRHGTNPSNSGGLL